MKPAPPVTRTFTIGLSRPFLPLSSSTTNDGEYRADQDLQVEPDRPMINVLEVHSNPVGELSHFVATIHLPKARNSRLHTQLSHLPEFVLLVLRWKRRSWSHETHVAFEHTPEL